MSLGDTQRSVAVGPLPCVCLCLGHHVGCWVGMEMGARVEAGDPWEGAGVRGGEMMGWVWAGAVRRGDAEP